MILFSFFRGDNEILRATILKNWAFQIWNNLLLFVMEVPLCLWHKGTSIFFIDQSLGLFFFYSRMWRFEYEREMYVRVFFIFQRERFKKYTRSIGKSLFVLERVRDFLRQNVEFIVFWMRENTEYDYKEIKIKH